MTDPTADATPDRPLTPANRNPWYVLATLYGEQEGEEIDRELHAKNRAAWNAWSCRKLSQEERKEIVTALPSFSLLELDGWSTTKENVIQTHKSEWLRRNSPNSAYPGLPNVDLPINFQYVSFRNPLSMSGFVFPLDLRFDCAEFSRYTEFSFTLIRGRSEFVGTRFMQHANFYFAKFDGDADFGNSVFDADARFVGARFQRHVRFNDSTFRSNCVFLVARFSEADFASAIFDYSDFERATFAGNVDFDSAKFNVDARFDGATFEVSAKFSNATFGGTAHFGYGKFRGEAWFEGTTFNETAGFNEASFSDCASFHNARFENDSWFHRATFAGEARFDRTSFHGAARFDGALFNQRVAFVYVSFGKLGGAQSVSFADCKFDKPLNCRDAKFLAQYPIFSGAITADRNVFTAKPDHWPETTTQDPEQARESCATIRHMLDKQGLPEEAHFFFRREMDFAGRTGTLWQRLPYRLYGALSDYGQSIARPAVGLLSVVAFGWAVIRTWLGRPDRPAGDVNWFDPIPEALVLSVANTLPFLGLARTKLTEFHALAPPGFVVFSAVQSLAGIVLLFLLGLGLRTRFRMR